MVITSSDFNKHCMWTGVISYTKTTFLKLCLCILTLFIYFNSVTYIHTHIYIYIEVEEFSWCFPGQKYICDDHMLSSSSLDINGLGMFCSC